MKKRRLNALDGIRGLAAINVLFFHLDLFKRYSNNISLPFLVSIFNFFAAGNNGVQIYFVLSGFLMAYLHPKIVNKFDFIKKRYTRIIPTYITVITFLWLITLYKTFHKLPFQIVILVLLIIAANYFIHKMNNLRSIYKDVLLYSYIFLQILMIMYGVYIAIFPITIDSNVHNSLLTLIANLTLTYLFIKDMSGLTIVSWSLVFQMIFYILYPLIFVDVIKIAKKRGVVSNILFVSLIAATLFTLELIIPTIARASSFIAGICIGVIYKSNSRIWRFLKRVFTIPQIGILVLFLFIFIQWSDLNFAGLALFHMNGNIYLLILNLILASLLITILIPGTLPNRIFSSKVLVFIGLISFSMFLIHGSVVNWNYSIYQRFIPFVPVSVLLILLPIFVLVSTIIVSYYVFKFIEKTL